MTRFLQCTKFLKLATAGTGLFGAVMVGAPDFTGKAFEAILFTSRGLDVPYSDNAQPHVKYLNALMGAVMIGWAGSMYGTLTSRAWMKKDMHAWKSIALPIAVWFVIDSLVSYSTGNEPNLAINVLFAALFAVPLFMVKGEFIEGC